MKDMKSLKGKTWISKEKDLKTAHRMWKMHFDMKWFPSSAPLGVPVLLHLFFLFRLLFIWSHCVPSISCSIVSASDKVPLRPCRWFRVRFPKNTAKGSNSAGLGQLSNSVWHRSRRSNWTLPQVEPKTRNTWTETGRAASGRSPVRAPFRLDGSPLQRRLVWLLPPPSSSSNPRCNHPAAAC